MRRREFSPPAAAVIIAILAAVAFILLITQPGCTWVTPAPVVVDPSATCEQAAKNLHLLDCAGILVVPGPDEKPGTEDDVPWVDFCNRVQASGIMQLAIGCYASAVDCAAAERCQ